MSCFFVYSLSSHFQFKSLLKIECDSDLTEAQQTGLYSYVFVTTKCLTKVQVFHSETSATGHSNLLLKMLNTKASRQQWGVITS